MNETLKAIRRYFVRNYYVNHRIRAKRNKVNLLYWDYAPNAGDALSPVIYKWMLEQKGLSEEQETKKTTHLLAVGSIIGLTNQDAVVWGSGIHRVESIIKIAKESNWRKLDVRAVRGPVTREILSKCGYECPEIYGDPAILMPKIYQPLNQDKRYKYSVICHMNTLGDVKIENEDIHYIDIKTDNYQQVIDEIVQSQYIISSSLHGIILAESYGVPAVMLCNGIEIELMKYYDWYYATGRKEIPMVYNIQQGLKYSYTIPPDMTLMQQAIINAFPYDLFK